MVQKSPQELWEEMQKWGEEYREIVKEIRKRLPEDYADKMIKGSTGEQLREILKNLLIKN